MVKRMTVEQHLQRYAILPLLFVADSSEGRVCMSCASSWLAGWLLLVVVILLAITTTQLL
jgi:hypothetical protein